MQSRPPNEIIINEMAAEGIIGLPVDNHRCLISDKTRLAIFNGKKSKILLSARGAEGR